MTGSSFRRFIERFVSHVRATASRKPVQRCCHRLGAADGRPRTGHCLRPHGRDQPRPWRADHAWGLHHLRGAADLQAACAAAGLQRLRAGGASPGFHRQRCGRHPAGTHRDSPALWQPAGDLASDLGCQLDSSAVCAECSPGPRRWPDAGAGAGLWPAAAASLLSSLGTSSSHGACGELGCFCPGRCAARWWPGLTNQSHRPSHLPQCGCDCTQMDARWYRIHGHHLSCAAPGDHRDHDRCGGWGDVVPQQKCVGHAHSCRHPEPFDE